MNWYKKAQDFGFPENFNPRSKGSCMYASQMIVENWLKEGIKDFLVIEGWISFGDKLTSQPESELQHTWIEYQGKIYDPTLVQFEGHYNIKDAKYIKIKQKFTPQEYLEHCKLYPEPEIEIDRYYDFEEEDYED